MDIVTKTKRVLRTGNPQIYILKDCGNNALKIGFSIDFDKRLTHHSTANPFLKLIALLPVQNQQIEYKLHKAISRFRIPKTAEWYSDSESLRNLLNSFLVSEGILDSESIPIAIKFLLDSNAEIQNFIHLKLGCYDYSMLVNQAWLNNRSLSDEAKTLLHSQIEQGEPVRDRMLTKIADRLGITKHELEEAIYAGTIASDDLTTSEIAEAKS